MTYSFYWAGMEGMKKNLEMLKSEGMENVYNRHRDCKQLARTEIKRMGLQLFVEKDEDASESVTSCGTIRSRMERCRLRKQYALAETMEI